MRIGLLGIVPKSVYLAVASNTSEIALALVRGGFLLHP